MGTNSYHRNKGIYYINCAILSLQLFFLNPLYAIPSNISLKQCRSDTWTARDGLPQRTINNITQTPDGFIWLATYEGLIRFDGNRFETFNHLNTKGLTNSKFTRMMIDTQGTLWCGTSWSGMGTFKDGVYTQVSPVEKEWNSVNCILQASDNTLWVGMSSFNIELLHIIGKQQIRLKLSNIEDTIKGVAELPNRQILAIGNAGGLYYIDQNNKIVSQSSLPVKLSQKTDAIWVTKAITDHNKSVWIGTRNQGLIRIENGKFTIYNTNNGLISNAVNCIYEDKQNRIWVGTNNGLDCWDGRTFQHYNRIDGLNDACVYSVYEDREDNLWVGSGSSLSRFTATKLTPYTCNYGLNMIALKDYQTLSMIDGEIWCCTDVGLCILSEKGVKWIGDGFHQVMNGIYTDPNGIAWISYGGDHDRLISVPVKELVRISQKVSWNNYTIDSPQKPDNVNSLNRYHPINCLNYSSSVSYNNGLFVAAYDCYEIIDRNKQQFIKDKLKYGWVFNVAKDNNGVIWIGSTNGLFQFKNNRIYECNEGLPESIHVLSIDTFVQNTQWLATDHGLIRKTKDSVTSYGLDSGLPSIDLWQLRIDNVGNIWLAGSEGIFGIKLSDVDKYDRHVIHKIPCMTFTSADGVRNYPAGFSSVKAKDGSIYFTCDRTIIKIDPSNITYNPIPPNVVIISAYYGNTKIQYGGDNSLKYQNNRLSIQYAAMSFAAPEKVRFQYRLHTTSTGQKILWGGDSLDTGWVDSADKRSVNFNNLSPGTYIFQVIACNNDNVWNNKGVSLAFTITPQYYQTLWFKSILYLLSILVIGILFYWRVRRIRQYNIELEVKVQDRTKELSAARHELVEQHNELEHAHLELMGRNEELEAMQEELEAQNEELVAMQETLERANERLAGIATTDGLTGLKNHRAFQEHLHDEWERTIRSKSTISLLMLDVDHFKQHNDTFGHPAGDEVLRQIARLLTENTRQYDFVARYGGEEFVIVAPDTNNIDAIALGERLRTAIESAEWTHRPVTASFGVCTMSYLDALNDHSYNGFIKKADMALYYSKHNGRNRVTHILAIEDSNASKP